MAIHQSQSLFYRTMIPWLVGLFVQPSKDIQTAAAESGVSGKTDGVGRAVIIYSCGGAGHKMVAEHIEEELKTKNIKVVAKRDVLHEMTGLGRSISHLIGTIIERVWNNAKQAGDNERQEDLIAGQRFGDNFFFFAIFVNSLILLIKHQPSQFIIDQPTGIEAMAAAVKAYNRFFKPASQPDCTAQIYLTDLASDAAVHFIRPLRELPDNLKSLVYVHTDRPLTPEETAKAPGKWEDRDAGMLQKIHQEQEQFWAEVGIDPSRIRYYGEGEEKIPIRKEFYDLDFSRSPYSDTFSIPFSIGMAAENKKMIQEEREFLEALFQQKEICAQFNEKGYTLELAPQDFAAMVMLGSQPPRKAVQQYAEEFIQGIKALTPEERKGRRFYLFALSGKHNHSDSLFAAIHKRAVEEKLEKEICIIPCTFQGGSTVAPLQQRCDVVDTAGGGSSYFEHVYLYSKKNAQGIAHKVLIHTEVPSEEDLVRLFKEGPTKGRIKGLTRQGNRDMHELMKSIQYSFQRDDRSISDAQVAAFLVDVLYEELCSSGLIPWEWKNTRALMARQNAGLVAPIDGEGSGGAKNISFREHITAAARERISLQLPGPESTKESKELPSCRSPEDLAGPGLFSNRMIPSP